MHFQVPFSSMNRLQYLALDIYNVKGTISQRNGAVEQNHITDIKSNDFQEFSKHFYFLSLNPYYM